MSTVANSGLPLAESDLYRLSLPSPRLLRHHRHSLGAGDVPKGRQDQAEIALIQCDVQIGGHILLGLQMLGRIPRPGLRLCHTRCLLQPSGQLQRSSHGSIPGIQLSIASSGDGGSVAGDVGFKNGISPTCRYRERCLLALMTCGNSAAACSHLSPSDRIRLTISSKSLEVEVFQRRSTTVKPRSQN